MTSDVTNWTRRDDASVERAIRGGASRRDLLQMLLAGGVGLAASGSLIARASAAATDAPVKGGHFKAAGWSTSTADTLDPAHASLSTDYVRCCSLYNRLTYLPESGDVEMELADSIESADATVWTVKLKKGVTFHDGKTLSAADVVFSLRRHLDPAIGSKVNAIAKQIVAVDAVDALTAKITLQAPNGDLPTILAMHHFMIVPDGATDFSKGVGTGPFKLQTFEPGVRSVMTRNENYFKAGKPYLDSFEYIAISDDSARVNALLSGDIQLAASVNPQAARLADRTPGFTTLANTSGNYTNLNMRLDMAPGEKADFVEAVKCVLNREQIIKVALRGQGILGNDQPIPPMSRYHNADLKPRAYDPEKAKALFKKSGFYGQTVPIIASDAATSSIDIATLVQQSAAAIGMKFDIQRVPSDGYWSNYWLKAPIHFGNINPRPTPDIMFSLLYRSNAPWNESHFSSEKFDKMADAARAELDFAKRKAIYDEMQVIVSNQAGTAIPAYLSDVDAFSAKLKGMRTNPLGGQMGYALAERVWLVA